MKKLNFKFSLLFCLVANCTVLAEEVDADRLLERIDRNFNAESMISNSTMIIEGRRGERTIKAKSWSRGEEQSFTEYLYPPREKGTKMLKLKDQLWTYTPSSDRIIKIAGHMLRQSVMGSDLSYEDFMENDRLSEEYSAVIEGEETIEERPCWVLRLTAKTDQVSYHSRKIWVDKQRYLALREERFARSGKLLKTLQIKEVMKVDQRWYPKKMVFKDALKQGSGTRLIINSIQFNVEIPDYVFSKAALRR